MLTSDTTDLINASSACRSLDDGSQNDIRITKGTLVEVLLAVDGRGTNKIFFLTINSHKRKFLPLDGISFDDSCFRTTYKCTTRNTCLGYSFPPNSVCRTDSLLLPIGELRVKHNEVPYPCFVHVQEFFLKFLGEIKRVLGSFLRSHSQHNCFALFFSPRGTCNRQSGNSRFQSSQGQWYTLPPKFV